MSIDLDPLSILNGESYSLTKIIHRGNTSYQLSVLNKTYWSEYNGSNIRLASVIQPSKSYKWLLLTWIMVNSCVYPKSGYVEIPIAWIESKDVFGSLSVAMYAEHGIKLNVGYSVESTNTVFGDGATLWTGINNFSKSYEFLEKGDAGYIYIEGKVEAARYRLVITGNRGDIIYYYNVYQDIVGIIDLKTDKSEIIGGVRRGLPTQINTISQEFIYRYYIGETGSGNINRNYKHHLLLNKIIGDSLTIALGATLTSVFNNTIAGISPNILTKLTVSISLSSQNALIYLDYDTCKNYNIYIYIRTSSIQYTTKNGEQTRTSLAGIKIIGYFSYSSRPS